MCRSEQEKEVSTMSKLHIEILQGRNFERKEQKTPVSSVECLGGKIAKPESWKVTLTSRFMFHVHADLVRCPPVQT